MAEANTRAPRAPDEKDGNIALWKEQTPNGNPVYKLVEETGPKDARKKEYTLLYPEINGQTISPKEAIALKRGDSIEMTFQGGKGPYVASVALDKIENRPWKTDQTKSDQVMRVALVMHLNKKEGGEHYGFEVGGRANSVRFFKNDGPKGADRVELEARDVVRLAQGETIQKGPYNVRVAKVEENDGRRTARLSFTTGQSEKLPDEADLKPAARARVAV